MSPCVTLFCTPRHRPSAREKCMMYDMAMPMPYSCNMSTWIGPSSTAKYIHVSVESLNGFQNVPTIDIFLNVFVFKWTHLLNHLEQMFLIGHKIVRTINESSIPLFNSNNNYKGEFFNSFIFLILLISLKSGTCNNQYFRSFTGFISFLKYLIKVLHKCSFWDLMVNLSCVMPF